MTRLTVGWGSRLSSLIFGSPSASRANGWREASLTPSRMRNASWQEAKRSVPVYSIDASRSAKETRLPRVWVSEPAYDGWTGEIEGRDLVSSYPNGRDEGGVKAFELAEGYFGEAVSCESAAEGAHRVECFRAAELLYLHAAERGNVDAMTKLGVIYRDDLCAGSYWGFRATLGNDAWMWCQERAVSCLTRAATSGSAEACWLLGDMMVARSVRLQSGKSAFEWYERALELSGGEPASFGNAALRMGESFERGRGCEQSFEQALRWYEVALRSLDEAFDAGGWYWKRPRAQARMGVRRMRQEIAACY